MVIDDGSTDGMNAVLAGSVLPHSELLPIRTTWVRNQAILTAFDQSNSDVNLLDADLSTPEHIWRLYKPLKDNVADLVLASTLILKVSFECAAKSVVVSFWQ